MSEAETRLAVRVENVVKQFGGFRALDGVSFDLRQGEILGLLGPNGAGKTTTMRILTGFFPPTRGRVWIHEKELFRNPKFFKKKIGYLPESIQLYGDMRVSEFLLFVAAVKGVPRKKRKGELEEKMGRCGLGGVRHRLIGKLSKGYRQRVGLAQALIGDPPILILDEPTSGLDPKQIIEIRTLIRELGRERTLILSTHILPEVSMVCDRVLIMNQGRVIASGTTEHLASGLRDKQEIFVTIGDPLKKEGAVRLLESIAEVEHLHTVEEKADFVSFSLSISRGKDLRGEITRLFVANEIPLLEIRSGQLSLEDIFMKLVMEENPPFSQS